MEFEWDDAKRAGSLDKHGIDFARAITIWRGDLIDPAATRVVDGEERLMALGTIGDDDLIICVVYTWRGEARRIISVRRARRYERQRYTDQFGRGA